VSVCPLDSCRTNDLDPDIWHEGSTYDRPRSSSTDKVIELKSRSQDENVSFSVESKNEFGKTSSVAAAEKQI